MSRFGKLCLISAILAGPFVAQSAVPKGSRTARTSKAPKSRKGSPMITTPSGLQYVEITEGTGPCPKPGQICVVHYTGWLSQNGAKGTKFDSSVDRGEPLSFPVGTGRVIKGWDEGLLSLKKGGKRTLHIPADLGYGSRGAGGVIPPGAALIFDVELLDIR